VLAVHINHGLHPDAGNWAAHCRKTAERLAISCEVLTVAVADDAGSGPEAAARQARYAALLTIMQDDDCLLSGHHENDQAETLLLNLMRGSGPAGLAGIGARQSFGRGMLLRPMLGVPGDAIGSYAARHGLEWIDDPSNIDTRFDRNFLRQEMMPRLASRWPAVANRLRRSAELVSEASELLNDLADIDIDRCGSAARVDLPAFRELTSPRQRNLVRRAVRRCGLPPPPATRLHQVIHELVPARPDAQPLVEWAGAEVRRYRDSLYVMATLPDLRSLAGAELKPGDGGIALGTGQGTILLVENGTTGITPEVAGRGLRLAFRQGGEALRIAAGGPTRKLKKLLQETGVLPWMRDRIPLFFSGERLVAVADLWVSADFAADKGIAVEWRDQPAIREPAAL
jgi:tRNA(Ile)-lysidine synthase